MMNHALAATHPIIIWALSLVSILLAAGITYIYTNRNKRLTFIFSLLSILSIGLAKLIGVVSRQLHQQFIGSFDESRIPYMISKPGWQQLLDAWHIWVLPVVFVVTLFSLLFYAFFYYHKAVPHIDKAVLKAPVTPPSSSQTRAEKLSRFMMMDAAKKESQYVNEKLAEALLMNAAYEIKISDLTMHAKHLERQLTEKQQQYSEETTILQLELAAKSRESTHILEQLAERSKELAHAHQMFEELLALQQQPK